MESSPDAWCPVNTEMETDGWYADLEAGFDCDNAAYSAPVNARSDGHEDRNETKQTGSGKRGFAQYEKMTMLDGSGKETMTAVSEVIELREAVLDAALFDVPPGYREVEDAANIYPRAGNPISTPVSKNRKGNCVMDPRSRQIGPAQHRHHQWPMLNRVTGNR